jgi:hypothetical protein
LQRGSVDFKRFAGKEFDMLGEVGGYAQHQLGAFWYQHARRAVRRFDREHTDHVILLQRGGVAGQGAPECERIGSRQCLATDVEDGIDHF